MTPRRFNPPPADPAARPYAGGRNGGGRFVDGGRAGANGAQVDWAAFLRRVERKRRMLRRSAAGANGQPPAPPLDYYARATFVSFRLDGHHDLAEADVRAALGVGPDGFADPAAPQRPAVPLRSRLSQRLRNHAAILHHVENALRKGTPLTVDGVLRWYTTVSAGLSTNSPNPAALGRLDEVVRRVNSPHLRIQAALLEIAATHVRLLADPLVPGFNGILARLLLRYHLGRCQLPAVVFDPGADGRPAPVDVMVGRLVQLLERSYDELLGRR